MMYGMCTSHSEAGCWQLWWLASLPLPFPLMSLMSDVSQQWSDCLTNVIVSEDAQLHHLSCLLYIDTHICMDAATPADITHPTVTKMWQQIGNQLTGNHLTSLFVMLEYCFATVAFCARALKWNVRGIDFAGIAFPTCISVNSCICHFSPLKSEPDLEIKPGDVVKM